MKTKQRNQTRQTKTLTSLKPTKPDMEVFDGVSHNRVRNKTAENNSHSNKDNFPFLSYLALDFNKMDEDKVKEIIKEERENLFFKISSYILTGVFAISLYKIVEILIRGIK